MKRFLIVFGIFVFLFNPAAFGAESAGRPDEYRVTINKVEWYNSTKDIWETCGEGDYTFDITSVRPGQLCGGYGTPVNFSKGIYTRMRVTISRTMQLKGTLSFGGNTYYTKTGTNAAINEGNAFGLQVANATATAPAVLGTMVVPSNVVTLAADPNYFIVEQALVSPAVLGPGTSKRADIKFDTATAFRFNDDLGVGNIYCLVDAPVITVEFK